MIVRWGYLCEELDNENERKKVVVRGDSRIC